jgi:hypothetical protein
MIYRRAIGVDKQSMSAMIAAASKMRLLKQA